MRLNDISTRAGLVLLAMALTATLAAAAATPQIRFDKTVCDLGKLTDVERVTNTFTFRNEGDGVLELREPRTTCGCTVAAIKSRTLTPGQVGELSFALSVPPIRTKLEKQIFVESNDPQHPGIVLTVRADCQPLYEYSPRMLNLTLHRQATTNVVIQLKRTDGKKLTIARVETKQKWITAEVRSAGPQNEQEASIQISVNGDGPAQRLADWVWVFTDDEGKPACSIYTYVRVVGELVWNPEAVVWTINDTAFARKQRSEAMFVRRLSVRPFATGQSFELSNLKSTLPGVSLQLERGEAGRSYIIVASLDKIPPQSASGKITFESNLPEQRLTEVPAFISLLRH